MPLGQQRGLSAQMRTLIVNLLTSVAMGRAKYELLDVNGRRAIRPGFLGPCRPGASNSMSADVRP